MKPFSEACERNKEPIVQALQRLFAKCERVLEIGSGTGQHAVWFAGRLPHLHWQPSDLRAHHAGMLAWRQEAGLANLAEPLELDVSAFPWPDIAADAVFSANTLHIMSWHAVQAFFTGVGSLLPPAGRLVVYGPFIEAGQHTAPSNAAFDEWLRRRDPLSGIRDREALNQLANQAGLSAVEVCDLPANNRLLVWDKNPDSSDSERA